MGLGQFFFQFFDPALKGTDRLLVLFFHILVFFAGSESLQLRTGRFEPVLE